MQLNASLFFHKSPSLNPGLCQFNPASTLISTAILCSHLHCVGRMQSFSVLMRVVYMLTPAAQTQGLERNALASNSVSLSLMCARKQRDSRPLRETLALNHMGLSGLHYVTAEITPFVCLTHQQYYISGTELTTRPNRFSYLCIFLLLQIIAFQVQSERSSIFYKVCLPLGNVIF
jgi:hypothetical protein